MIDREMTIIMLCDNCGNVLTDESGEVIRLFDSPYDYKKILHEALDRGWRPRLDTHLCPACVKKYKEREQKK